MANKGVQLKDSGGNLLYPNPYPVGSVYISTINTNPKKYYGGTWVQIVDYFLYCVSSGATETGGTSSHSHTVNEHTHTSAAHSHDAGGMTACIGAPTGNSFGIGYAAVGPAGPNSAYSVGGNSAYASGHPGRSHNTAIVGSTSETTPGNTGKSSPGTNSATHLPPYFKVYAWYRTA